MLQSSVSRDFSRGTDVKMHKIRCLGRLKETHLEQTTRDFARFKIKSQSDNLLLRARCHFLANTVTFSIANRENWRNILSITTSALSNQK